MCLPGQCACKHWCACFCVVMCAEVSMCVCVSACACVCFSLCLFAPSLPLSCRTQIVRDGNIVTGRNPGLPLSGLEWGRPLARCPPWLFWSRLLAAWTLTVISHHLGFLVHELPQTVPWEASDLDTLPFRPLLDQEGTVMGGAPSHLLQL